MTRKFISRKELKQNIQKDTTQRTTISFYKYVKIQDTQAFQDTLFSAYTKLGVLGRIYIATEGINAQLSVPSKNLQKFRQFTDSLPETQEVPLK